MEDEEDRLLFFGIGLLLDVLLVLLEKFGVKLDVAGSKDIVSTYYDE
jgi:hypothetical protein